MIFPYDSTARSWVAGADGSDFPIQNLPFAVFRRPGESPRAGVAIGDRVLDLARADARGLLAGTPVANRGVFNKPTLNHYMSLGRETWSAVRRRLVSLLAVEDVPTDRGERVPVDARIRKDSALAAEVLKPREDIALLMPARIANFVDFYSSREHASNVGSMFRDPANPLPPNWLHLPIGYNGRSSSIVISGTEILRPAGQTRKKDEAAPTFGPSRALDMELEMGFFVGPGNELGRPIAAMHAPDHIFGMVLVNDWSARDLQQWEYVPLGPFLGKSFATSISPWIVTLDALQPLRVEGPQQDPPVLDYLRTHQPWALDIELEAEMRPAGSDERHRLCVSNFKHLYWSIIQQLAHLTSNGTNAESGDLYASGTVSGPSPDSYGSLLELTWGGSKPITLPNGEQRRFLDDGDEIRMSGFGDTGAFRIGFGEVTGRIVEADGRR